MTSIDNLIPGAVREAPELPPFILWEELADYWNEGEFYIVHDWINERWGRIVNGTVEGERNELARFLRALAYAALTFHFAREHSYESARLFLDDALKALPPFAPAWSGVAVQTHIDRLTDLDRVLPVPGDGRMLTEEQMAFSLFSYNTRKMLL